MTELLRRLTMIQQEAITIHPDYPEEYITGRVTFFGRTFRVTPAVLIPRLETEGLVRRAGTVLRGEKYKLVADIGCGSGIIGTSIADLVDEVVFLDISPEALKVAEENFRTHFPEKKAQFIESDLLTNDAGCMMHDENILFLANLPYIKAEDWSNMSSDTRYEPELALFGGDNTGFELYERLFKQLHMLHNKGGIIIEFGFDQREIAERVIQIYGWEYDFFADYAGIERFCEIKLTK